MFNSRLQVRREFRNFSIPGCLGWYDVRDLCSVAKRNGETWLKRMCDRGKPSTELKDGQNIRESGLKSCVHKALLDS